MSRLRPAFLTLLFLLSLLVTLSPPEHALLDPGTPWHLATGHYILTHHALPTNDIFAHTIPDHHWLTYEWLFQVIIAALENLGRLPLVTAVCMVLYSLLPVFLLQRMLQAGSDLFFSIFSALIALLILWPHALVRPHIATYLFLLFFLDRLSRFERGEITAPSLCWLGLLMIPWCNLHGGFLVGLVTVGAYWLSALITTFTTRGSSDPSRLPAYSIVLLLCTFATVINPHGLNLILELVTHLHQPYVKYWQEFQPPDFIHGGSSVRLYGWLLLALGGLLVSRRVRPSLAEWILFAFLLYQSLQAVRHMILVTLLIAPWLAHGLSELWPRWSQHWAHLRTQQLALAPQRLDLPLLAAITLWLSLFPSSFFRRDFLDLRLSRGAANYMANQPQAFSCFFNTDDLGGALIYQFTPYLKVYMDDRSDLYRQDFIENHYLPVLRAESRWPQILDSHHVTSAVVTNGTPIARALSQSAAWSSVYQDEHVLLFLKNK